MPGVMCNGVDIMHAESIYACTASTHILSGQAPPLVPPTDPNPSRVMVNNSPVLTDGTTTSCCLDKIIATTANVKVNGKPVILFTDKTFQGAAFLPPLPPG